MGAGEYWFVGNVRQSWHVTQLCDVISRRGYAGHCYCSARAFSVAFYYYFMYVFFQGGGDLVRLLVCRSAGCVVMRVTETRVYIGRHHHSSLWRNDTCPQPTTAPRHPDYRCRRRGLNPIKKSQHGWAIPQVDRMWYYQGGRWLVFCTAQQTHRLDVDRCRTVSRNLRGPHANMLVTNSQDVDTLSDVFVITNFFLLFFRLLDVFDNICLLS